MKKVYIKSNGCAVLIHETERIAQYFTLNGWNLVEHPEEAKILIMTCCGVTQNEEDEAIGIITEIESRRAAESHFIISGCMPSFARERVLDTSPQATVLKWFVCSKPSVNPPQPAKRSITLYRLRFFIF